MLTLLASQAAVAIENARLYDEVSRNEERIEKELRFAQRVQTALLPTELPEAAEGVDVAGTFEPARELGGDFHEYLAPDSQQADRRGRRRVRQGRAGGALRRVRRRAGARAARSAGAILRSIQSCPACCRSMNTILHERQLEEYYCTLCYAMFDFKRRTITLSNSGLPYPIRCSGDDCEQIELPGVPLGRLPASRTTSDVPLHAGDVFVFCTDGISEAMECRRRGVRGRATHARW